MKYEQKIKDLCGDYGYHVPLWFIENNDYA